MTAVKQCCEEWKVYLVRVLKTGKWYPHPFAHRESAHNWAQARGYAEEDYDVEGFRVRD